MSTVGEGGNESRSYDIVLVGATGFTGRLTADYLAAHSPSDLRWALAGRNRTRLEEVAAQLVTSYPLAPKPSVVEVEASDGPALRRLAESTRVVASTVGPYVSHGDGLVGACAAAGTDYCDITGEAEFVDRCWNRYHALAEKTGARLVHSCGFDSIPHDFGAYYTVKQLPEDVPLTVDGFVRMSSMAMLSGGSFQTAVEMFSRGRSIAAEAAQRTAAEPTPHGRKIVVSSAKVTRQAALGGWALPAPTIDGAVVRRSAAEDDRYGPSFAYGHNMLMPNLAAIAAMGAVVATIATLSRIRPTRSLVRRLKPAGTGPALEARQTSTFSATFIGAGGGRRVVTEVAGGDPATTETAMMLGETALCLAFDELPSRAGQLTPVTAMGDALLHRIQAAGLRFRVLESAATPM